MPPTDNHQFIWKRFVDGDNDALSMIYFDYFDMLLNFGIKYVSDKLLVEDCIQNLFVDLMRNREKLGDVRSIRFYLFKALRNKISNEIRRKNRWRTVSGIEESEFQISYTIENKLIDRERDEIQAKLIELISKTLTGKQKEALYLKFNCGFDYVQIAEVMDIHTDSARTLIYRTFKQIKQTFGDTIANEMILLHFFRMTTRLMSET